MKNIFYALFLALIFVGCGGSSSSEETTTLKNKLISVNCNDRNNTGKLSNSIGFIGADVCISYTNDNNVTLAVNLAHNVANSNNMDTFWQTLRLDRSIGNTLVYKDNGNYCISTVAPYSQYNCNNTFIYGINANGNKLTDNENTIIEFIGFNLEKKEFNFKGIKNNGTVIYGFYHY